MRILVGQIWHEGHSFNPIGTRKEDFLFGRGAPILVEARSAGTAFGGIVRRAEQLGHTCVPVLSARARPGGPVDEQVYQEIASEFEVAAKTGQFDAICLELHGATSAKETVDTEGDLLQRIRKIVGPSMPIAIALDLHAYLTPSMVEAATIITAYRTTPHADMPETGERAMQLLHGILTEGHIPHPSRVLVPFLTRGNDETSSGPLVEIGTVADRYRADPQILDLSIFNIHPFLDVPGIGQVVLSYDLGGGEGQTACDVVAHMLWDRRDEFTEQLMSVDEALSLAAASPQPFALGDQGDRVVGAGPGDSAEIVRIALERFPRLRVASAIYDPGAVSTATAAGVGARVDIAVGGTVTAQLKPLQLNWRVRDLRPACFTNKGPYMAGVEADFGDAAVLTHGGLTVVVTTKAPNVHDPAFYETMDIPIASQDVLVCRAANHYKLSFAGLARTITVDTPGLTAFRPHEFPFKKARPFYPLDPVQWP